jgi:hypothetical protein
MADQADVENALVAAISGALYPNGTEAQGIVSQAVKIYRGWPNTTALRADLTAGVLNVTVFPVPHTTRNTTRWASGSLAVGTVVATLTAVTAGTNVTFGGVASVGQLAGILADGVAFVHRTTSGDTPELVAQTLGAMIATRRTALVSGATVTVPGAGQVIGRTVADQPVVAWTRNQTQQFRVSCWCPDPPSRDAVAAAIDGALASVAFIAFADGSSGRLRYVATTEFDQSQDAALFRRDLVFAVDYPTTLKQSRPAMIFGNATLGADSAGNSVSLLV